MIIILVVKTRTSPFKRACLLGHVLAILYVKIDSRGTGADILLRNVIKIGGCDINSHVYAGNRKLGMV